MPNNGVMSEFSLSADLAGLLSNENDGAEFPSAHFTAEPRHSSQGMLNRAHSLEPPDLDLQLLGTSDDELDEGFQAALQFLNESQDVDILEEVLLQPQATTFPTGNVDTSSTSASDPEDSGINASKAARSSEASTSSKPKRRHRVSTKQQIENLRGTVETLTAKLQPLKTNYATSQASEDSSTTVMSTKPMWQQIAARQLQRRQEAERDNARLRVMLDLQVQEAKMLKRILKRRTKIKMMEDMFGIKRQKTLANQTDSVNILHEMLRSTAEVYVGVDNYFSMKDINQLPYPGKTRMANRHAINDIFLEIVEKQMLPFPAKKTESAVWGALGQLAMQQLQCVKDINAQVDFYAQDSKHTDDTMMISYVAATSGFRGSDLQSVHIRKVMRKYVEACRTVLICRMETQPKHETDRKEIKLRCCVRVVVEKATPSKPNETESTMIQSSYSISRHVSLDENFQSYADGDMVIAVWDEMISRVAGDVESYLLDESLESQKCATIT